MIEIIPAIDIIDGRCVRLSQGDYARQTTYPTEPPAMARRFADAGLRRLHLVDLDGAKAGRPCNLATLRAIRAAVPEMAIEWGGGIKTDADLRAVFAAGADYAIIGSVAVKHPELMERWLAEFGGERIILGADLRDGKVATGGWLEDSTLTADNLLERFVPQGLTQAIVTDIARDGMLAGPSDALYADLQLRWPAVTFTVSGGVSSPDDLRRLDALGLRRAIVGKALYEGKMLKN